MTFSLNNLILQKLQCAMLLRFEQKVSALKYIHSEEIVAIAMMHIAANLLNLSMIKWCIK